MPAPELIAKYLEMNRAVTGLVVLLHQTDEIMAALEKLDIADAALQEVCYRVGRQQESHDQ